MDFEHNQDIPQSPPSAINEMSSPQKKRSGWKVLWGVLIGLVIIGNAALFMLLLGLAVFFSAGEKNQYIEAVIQSGPRSNKIAIINIQGIINAETAQDIFQQLKAAKKDKRIKGLILKVASPGGTISASDNIYNEIRKYRKETGKPIVAFMQGIAASGGYYTSAACNKIVAEPTTITGSIGVIMGYLVLKDLLEEKLGIHPVIVKSGRRKDWPSSFSKPTEEQLKYIDDKLIQPAYERFVNIVTDSRDELDIDQVRKLADGSIYGAAEALEEKLIDKIGYLDEAIEEIKSLAKIDDAYVVEYQKPFSLANFLNAKTNAILKIDRDTLYEFNTPQLMYLWSAP